MSDLHFLANLSYTYTTLKQQRMDGGVRPGHRAAAVTGGETGYWATGILEQLVVVGRLNLGLDTGLLPT